MKVLFENQYIICHHTFKNVDETWNNNSRNYANKCEKQ